MKKSIALILLVAICVGMVACGKKESVKSEADETAVVSSTELSAEPEEEKNVFKADETAVEAITGTFVAVPYDEHTEGFWENYLVMDRNNTPPEDMRIEISPEYVILPNGLKLIYDSYIDTGSVYSLKYKPENSEEAGTTTVDYYYKNVKVNDDRVSEGDILVRYIYPAVMVDTFVRKEVEE